ncbi:MAG: metal ABC transporter permease [Candidatus Micrarchaeota archaeon]|nr:metal ABC transporter permease [Candidatus Micrarchaeota archaeon]MDE1834683.1 metal ABC transporter permease [Candidatus Micrarchaeota archaeon]MDE1858987.1 metal ABC transporter permease [Candidatus Micrarchaeota archaeon]
MMLSVNLLAAFHSIFQYQFMQHAFEAGTIIAIVAGIIGYLVILRRTSFAAHAYAEIGFAGAAGSALIGINPLFGLLGASMTGGLIIALLGKRATNRDVEIGSVLAFALGLGLLFISLYTGYATEAYSILFGEILGISSYGVLITAIVSVVILVAAAFVYRPILFASLDEEVAEAKGMHTVLLGAIFMLLLAASVSIAIQVSGVLLIFALMVTPAATAVRLTKKPTYAIAISVLIALIATWSGLLIAFYEPYPVSFFIVSIVFGLYLLVRLISWKR